MKLARLYQPLENNYVRCLACSWYCQIAPKQVGICATRYNKKGRLYSLVYGYPIGLHLDPVEKKPLYHFYPGRNLLSFGTLGCNFGCLFCQNWEMSKINKLKIKNEKFKIKETIEKMIKQFSSKITSKEIVEMAINEGAKGIAYTYNEPAIFVEFARDCMVLAKKKGLKNVFVSNGFESEENFSYIKDYLDAINIDLKSFREDFYQKICRAKIKPVLTNIKRYFQAGIEAEVTTLIIPGYNDGEEELKDIAKFLVSLSREIPWHISAFFPAYQMVNVPPTPVNSLISTYEMGKKNGLHYVYVGNVSDSKRSATYCPKCNNLLISRFGYQVKIENLDQKNGCCLKCKQKIYGQF